MPTDEKRFPLQHAHGGYSRISIPWDVARVAYDEYERRYGTSQPMERMAQRGGFSPYEMDLFYPGWDVAAQTDWSSLVCQRGNCEICPPFRERALASAP